MSNVEWFDLYLAMGPEHFFASSFHFFSSQALGHLRVGDTQHYIGQGESENQPGNSFETADEPRFMTLVATVQK